MHQLDTDIPVKKQRTLKDFIPLVLTFFVGLVLLSIYQNTMLYFSGVLDSVVNKSLLLHSLHHIGFTAVVALLLAFVFNLLENKKPDLGFRIIKFSLAVLLVIEAVLVTYYIGNYEALGANFMAIHETNTARFSWSRAIIAITITITACYYIYKRIAPLYTLISRMYPFTIILFSLFLATLYTDKKPINENKTQYLLAHVSKHLLSANPYEGEAEYPLLQSGDYTTQLGSYFNFKEEKPTIKLLIIEGLGASLTSANKEFKAFMPALQELQNKSLVWTNFLSNTGESHAVLPTIIGSLPFGNQGFTHIPKFTNRNTLYSILGRNDYQTSFNYGGNSALHSYDKFLDEENVANIVDKKAFGKQYQLQEEDAAGITLGYPDKVLFQKYTALQQAETGPKLDVFLTLSSKEPYHIPNRESYLEQVEALLQSKSFTPKSRRLIENNEALFASFVYTDEAVHQFLENETKKAAYQNTIYIITGTHCSTGLPQPNALEKYRVPLIIYSPLLKSPKVFSNKASHADIAPSILGALKGAYPLTVPNAYAWLGKDLLQDTTAQKQIPLLRNAHNISDFIYGNTFVTDSDVYTLGRELQLLETEDETVIKDVLDRFNYFKSVNTYTTTSNKLLPQALSLVNSKKKEFSKADIIWIQSVFNGKDFDNAYRTARKIALNKDYDRSLLLCDYILSKIPRHADTEILMGRVYSWKQDYDNAIKTLSKVVAKYPKYEDGYNALLDALYWSENNSKVFEVKELIEKNNISTALVTEKIKRSMKRMQERNLKEEGNSMDQRTALVPKKQ